MELWGFVDAEPVMTLSDAESRALDMRFFAPRAAAGTGKALAIFKHISTGQAVCRRNRYFFILRGHRARDVRQVIGNFFFSYPDLPGNLAGTHLFFTQQGYDLLPNGGHGLLFVLVLVLVVVLDIIPNNLFTDLSFRCKSHNELAQN